MDGGATFGAWEDGRFSSIPGLMLQLPDAREQPKGVVDRTAAVLDTRLPSRMNADSAGAAVVGDYVAVDGVGSGRRIIRNERESPNSDTRSGTSRATWSACGRALSLIRKISSLVSGGWLASCSWS